MGHYKPITTENFDYSAEDTIKPDIIDKLNAHAAEFHPCY